MKVYMVSKVECDYESEYDPRVIRLLKDQGMAIELANKILLAAQASYLDDYDDYNATIADTNIGGWESYNEGCIAAAWKSLGKVIFEKECVTMIGTAKTRVWVEEWEVEE